MFVNVLIVDMLCSIQDARLSYSRLGSCAPNFQLLDKRCEYYIISISCLLISKQTLILFAAALLFDPTFRWRTYRRIICNQIRMSDTNKANIRNVHLYII